MERKTLIPPTFVQCCSSSLHTQMGPSTTSLQQPVCTSKHSSNSTPSSTLALQLLSKHSYRHLNILQLHKHTPSSVFVYTYTHAYPFRYPCACAHPQHMNISAQDWHPPPTGLIPRSLILFSHSHTCTVQGTKFCLQLPLCTCRHFICSSS